MKRTEWVVSGKQEDHTLQKLMAVFYLIMTLVTLILFNPAGIGANTLYYSLIFFAGYCLSKQVIYLLLSIFMIITAILLFVLSFCQLICKNKDSIFLTLMLCDLVLSVVLELFFAGEFVWWKTGMSIAFLLAYCWLRKKNERIT